MDPIVGLPLALLTLLMVSYPLLKKDNRVNEWEEAELWTAEDWDSIERDSIFAALTELEFDYRMNKISESDYSELRSQLMRRAVDLLKRSNDKAVPEEQGA